MWTYKVLVEQIHVCEHIKVLVEKIQFLLALIFLIDIQKFCSNTISRTWEIDIEICYNLKLRARHSLE